jgi:hypothetical protein
VIPTRSPHDDRARCAPRTAECARQPQRRGAHGGAAVVGTGVKVEDLRVRVGSARGGSSPAGWEQTGSSTPPWTARNGAKRMRTALNGIAVPQVRSIVAGQRVARRPFTQESPTALNGAELHRIAAVQRLDRRGRCKDPGGSSPLTAGSERGAALELISFRLRIEGLQSGSVC